MKYILTAILICVFCFGCEKEIVTEFRENQVNWKQHSEIEHLEKNILNGSVINNEIHLIGRNIFTRIDTSNNAFSSIFSGYDYHNIKIPMSDILMLTSEDVNEEGHIEFVYIPGLIEDGYAKSNNFVKFLDIDSSFLEFDYFDASQNIDFGAYNSEHQILLPYVGKASHFSFMLINLDINPSPNTSLSSDERYIEIEDAKIINIPKPNQTLDRQFVVYSTGQDFIISNNEITAKIYRDGTFKVINNPQFRPIRFFEIEGVLYAVNSNSSNIYSSIDSGESWEIAFETDSSAGTFMYSVINDKIILSKKSSIFELVFANNGFETIELENDALQGNFITSINSLHNKVYVSTLSGLFYRDSSDFFTPKIIE